MRSLDMFTMGELVAVLILVLQLILVAVVLRDKRLWRILQNWRRPRAARAQPEEQSSVDRAQESADTSPGSSQRSSMSSRKHFPRFIQSSQDTQVLFEEQHGELEAQLAQWQWEQGPFLGLQTERPEELPGLLGGGNSPQHLRVQRPDVASGRDEDNDTASGREEDNGTASGREEDNDTASGREEDNDTASGREEDNGTASGREEDNDMASGREEDNEATGRHSSSPPELESSSSAAMAWFLPREVVITKSLEADSSSSSSSSSLLELARSIPTPDPWWGPAKAPSRQRVPPGRACGWAPRAFLGKLCARLRGFLGPWWSCHIPACQCPHHVPACQCPHHVPACQCPHHVRPCQCHRHVPPCQCHRHVRPSRSRLL
ncbi:uncharacterized protein LOC113987081 [Pipra filicauda]|uniref:Uncharacterized protein LOC113987081 n=1 Tax=Pipra filicauda TaxID=649802 RepID=A0A6J2GIM8_9PASS|nr:uncharacterized protein LOC113987081 [Pipra filicauda]